MHNERQGRHFRDQTDPTNPICDYSGCTFFTSAAEFSDLPYPTDVSLGNVTGSEMCGPDGSNADLSTILKLLQEQKSESEKQNNHLQLLQQQVSALSQSRPPPIRVVK